MKRSGMTLGDLLTYAALSLALVVFLAPVLWMLITAVKPPGEWLTTPPILIPSELHWANFTDALITWGGAKGLEDSLIVAFMFELGRGVTGDYAEAARWYRKAAEQGEALAQDNLGRMYEQGRGVTQDYLLAHMWHNLAAAQGDDDAAKARDGLA